MKWESTFRNPELTLMRSSHPWSRSPIEHHRSAGPRHTHCLWCCTTCSACINSTGTCINVHWSRTCNMGKDWLWKKPRNFKRPKYCLYFKKIIQQVLKTNRVVDKHKKEIVEVADYAVTSSVRQHNRLVDPDVLTEVHHPKAKNILHFRITF